jgi:hypothetical protein
MDFRVAPAKAVDVGLETGTIEPAKHLVELLPEDEANDRSGKRCSLGRRPRDLTMAIGARDEAEIERLVSCP